ncbi:peptidase S8/S53 domain-containing protein [Roridomyces roridus]|uniref:Peptidase S8/S53 domain-containing protein n=1 Tax=Roridomyces roridus TaxID=1738132 RepID=A0AAD7F8S3_9AGAR|nr:peptidase S8/S53 domain-containing protein [Roridomyces roridus]
MSQLQETQYLIRLHDGIEHEQHFAALRGLTTPPAFTVVDSFDPSFLNAYVAQFDVGHLPTFVNHPDVMDVEEDTEDSVDYVTTESTESWGLSRINHNKAVSSTATTFNYTYENVFETGKNVHIYIMDSGIKLDHEDFGGRAKKAYVYSGGTSGDRKGHGTHVAGIAGGTKYGVAKAATLYEVKVLNDHGRAPKSRSIKAMQWLASNYISPAVANMSFGGGYSKIQNEAVDKLVAAGVHVSVAAGNDKKPASESSPASAKNAITVGATDKSDAMCKFSNYGSAVDVLAPGYKILSCGIASTSATATKSGTSMAAPFVAGIVASLISLHKGHKTYVCKLMKGLVLVLRFICVWKLNSILGQPQRFVGGGGAAEDSTSRTADLQVVGRW